MRWPALLLRVVRPNTCRDVAPGHDFDGITNSIERRYAQRCTRPTGHAGAHSDGVSTWKGER